MMTNRSLLIACALGLATAVLMFAPLRLGLLGALFSTFALTPMFASVLALGPKRALVSAGVLLLALSAIAGPLGAVASIAFTVLPAYIVGYIAGLSRDEGEGVEWYPLSRILLAVGLLAAITAIAYGLIMGVSAETLEAGMVEAAKQLSARSGDAAALEGRNPEEVAAWLGRVAPFMLPFSLVALFLLNLRFGERLARALGPVDRPREDLPRNVALPPVAAAGFGLATLLALVANGGIGLVGLAFAGAFSALFTAVGLATIHDLSRGSSARGLLLAAVYVSTILFSLPVVLLLVLGLAETLLGLRARKRAGST